MAEQTPLYLQNKRIPAKFDRQFVSSVFGGIEQVLGAGDLLLTATSGLGVSVAAGACVVQGDTNPGQGLYYCRNDAAVAFNHVAPSVNPKVDLVVARAYDSFEIGSGLDKWQIEIVPGVPQSGASLTDVATWPAVPASAMPIAAVRVTTAGAVTVLDLRPRTSGQSLVDTVEARAVASYGLLATPDQVPNVVVPTGGYLEIAFRALVKESVSDNARIALFIGSTQLRVMMGVSLNTQSAVISGTADRYRPIFSTPIGLMGIGLTGGTDATDFGAEPRAMGQLRGGAGTEANIALNGETLFPINTAASDTIQEGGSLKVEVAPGTYTVSVQYLPLSGSVTAKNRRLIVESKRPRA